MWGQKRKLNRKRSEAALSKFWFAVVLGGVCLGLAIGAIHWLIGLPTGVNLTHALIYTMPVLVYVWVLRLFAAQFKTNERLADDAEEREAMVLTFKALEYQQQASSEERA